jgi:hypothetical protein
MTTKEVFNKAVRAGHNRILMHNDISDVLIIINVDTPDAESERGDNSGEFEKIGTTFNTMRDLVNNDFKLNVVVIDSWRE